MYICIYCHGYSLCFFGTTIINICTFLQSKGDGDGDGDDDRNAAVHGWYGREALLHVFKTLKNHNQSPNVCVQYLYSHHHDRRFLFRIKKTHVYCVCSCRSSSCIRSSCSCGSEDFFIIRRRTQCRCCA